MRIQVRSWSAKLGRLILPLAGLLLVTSGIQASPSDVGQDVGQSGSVDDGKRSTSGNEFSAEIQSWQDRDMRADPDGSVAAMRDLKARVFADSAASLENRADAASLLGEALFVGQNYAESAEEFAQAGSIWEQIPGREDKRAEVLNNRGVILRALKRLPEAEASLREALAIRQTLYGSIHPDIASSTYSLGNVLFSQGRFEEALPLFRDAAAQQEMLTPDQPQKVVQRIMGLGAVLDESGRDREALIAMRHAEELARQNLGAEHQTYGTVLHNLGLLLTDMGMYEQATPLVRQAIEVRRKTNGEASPWTASSIGLLATILRLNGRTEEAIVLHEAALRIMIENRDVVGAEVIGRIYAEMARARAFEESWTEFYRQCDLGIAAVDAELGEQHIMRSTLHLLKARGLATQGHYEEALAIAERWVPVQTATLIPGHRDRIASELLLAFLRQQTGASPEDYWPMADDAIDRLQTELQDISRGESQRIAEARASRQAAISFLQMALDADDDDRAVLAAQLANVSALSLGLENPSADPQQLTLPEHLYSALIAASRVEAGLNQHRSVAVEAGDTELLTRLDIQIRDAGANRARIAAELAHDHPGWLENLRPTPLSLHDIRAGLGQDETLIIFVEGEHRSWALQIRHQGSLSARSFSSQQVATDVSTIRAAMEAGPLQPYPFAEAARLQKAIFGDGRRNISRKISVYGGVRLASIPLSILTVGPYDGPVEDAPWLIRYASIRTLGNLASLGPRGSKPSRDSSRRFAGIGGVVLPGRGATTDPQRTIFRDSALDSTNIGGLGNLPNAIGELRQIADTLGSDDRLMLVGTDASETAFKAADLSDRDLIVFATHGLTAGATGGLWEPSLLLGQADGDMSEDGLLGASEIARLNLSADWVILSACNTAIGSSADAPPFSGLATAFSQAGARSLLLSHWPVRDDAVALLTTGTVKNVSEGGLGRAEALRLAQLDLMRDATISHSASPSVWAPLILIE